MKSEGTKSGWLQIVGPLLGVIVGGLLSQFAAYSRQGFERDQTFLQHRITAFQNYSEAYSAGMSVLNEIIDQTMMDRGRVMALGSDLSISRFDPIFTSRAERLGKLTSALTVADAEMETRTIITNALFEPDIEKIYFLAHINDPELGKVTLTSAARYHEILESELVTHRQDRANIQILFQRNLKILQAQLKLP